MDSVATPAPEGQPPHWNLFTRIAFRFFGVYLLVYNYLESYTNPFDTWLAALYNFLRSLTVPYYDWFAVQFLGLQSPIEHPPPNGSGDTALAYMNVFGLLALAAAITVVWSLVDRKRAQYVMLHRWTRLLLRYSLATTLLMYGFAKVLPTQFPAPTLARLTETFGDFSPMGVLWSFMGASQPYTIFSGLMEVIPALLLIYRPTAVLGALSAAAVMLNVFVLNMSYDVPVKLFSFHLLVTALFLAAPELNKLVNLFVLRRPAEPFSPAGPIFTGRGWKIAAVACQLLFVLYAGSLGYRYYRNYETQVLAERSPLYGIWDVQTFEKDGKAVPAENPGRWRQVMFDNHGYMSFVGSSGLRGNLRVNYDPSASKISVIRPNGGEPDVLRYRLEEEGSETNLILEGSLVGTEYSIRTGPRNATSFRLKTRGFHWISDAPFNR